ncbi:MAG TPA: HNH endonuclease [Clostridiales bacterium]|nr:HNH endonuclease [Clostridiales bacterium]
MEVNFNNAKFSTDYSFASARSIVRTLSDAFSKQYCDTKGAIRYAAKATAGRCLYCGQPLYSLKSQIPVFSNMIHYDHIFPASKFNLFEVGNVALACETCNLAKSNRLPMEYYDMRTTEGGPLFIYERDEFEAFLNDMIKPYVDKWPNHYKASFETLDDIQLKEKLTELLYNPVSLEAANTRYNHEHSVNWTTWELVIKKAYDTYTPLTAKDVEGRIGYTNELFEEIFGHDVLIEDCKINELKAFTDKLLLSKYDSKNEIQKYRMLLKILTEVLNESLMQGQLDDFYKKIPTYSKINKNK